MAKELKIDNPLKIWKFETEVMLELSNDLKKLHEHNKAMELSMAIRLGTTGVAGYWLGTFIARRMRSFPNPRKFAIARVGMISLLSWGNVWFKKRDMDRKFAALPFRTRMVHEADIQATSALYLGKFPGSEHDRLKLCIDYDNWKKRMVSFPSLEPDRYGEDLLETSRDVVRRAFLNAEKVDKKGSRELRTIYALVLWGPISLKVFGDFGNRMPKVMESLINEQRNKFYKSIEDPVVKEKYVKVARQEIWVWGKKDQKKD